MKKQKTDRRVRKTKKQLHNAFAQLLQKKPIQKITVSELSDIVDINRGTFYSHYKDIYDMLAQIENEIFNDVNELFDTELSDSSELDIHKAATTIFSYFVDHGEMVLALMGENGDHTFINKLSAMIKTKVYGCYFKQLNKESEFELDYFYEYSVYGLIGLMSKWLKSKRTTPLSDMLKLAERFLLEGLQSIQ